MKTNIGKVLTIVGSIVMMICSLLPWFQIYKNSTLGGIVYGKNIIEGNVFSFLSIIAFILAILLKGKPGKTNSLIFTFIGIFASYYFMRFAKQVTPYVMDNSNGIDTVPTVWFYFIFVSSILISLGGLFKVPKNNDNELQEVFENRTRR